MRPFLPWLGNKAVMAVRCGSAAVRAGARRAVMAGAGVTAGRASLPQAAVGVKRFALTEN